MSDDCQAPDSDSDSGRTFGIDDSDDSDDRTPLERAIHDYLTTDKGDRNVTRISGPSITYIRPLFHQFNEFMSKLNLFDTDGDGPHGVLGRYMKDNYRRLELKFCQLTPLVLANSRDGLLDPCIAHMIYDLGYMKEDKPPVYMGECLCNRLRALRVYLSNYVRVVDMRRMFTWLLVANRAGLNNDVAACVLAFVQRDVGFRVSADCKTVIQPRRMYLTKPQSRCWKPARRYIHRGIR